VIIPRFTIQTLQHALFNDALTGMSTLTGESAKDMNYLIVMGWWTRIVEGVLRTNESAVSRWELVGWKFYKADKIQQAIIFIKIWP
jgi:hypothetical protein